MKVNQIKTSITKEKIRAYSFMEQDLISILVSLSPDTDLINICEHYDKSVENRITNFEEVIGKNNDCLISTTACISTIEFPESEYYCEEIDLLDEADKEAKKPIPFDETLKRECELLESLGFRSINEWEAYEFQVAYIYTGNNIGQKVYDYIMNIVIKNKKG